jgi:hypothetical protein
LCVAGGLVALATVRPWGRRLPRPVLRALAWFGFVLLAARDIYVEFGLGLTGITTVAAGERAAFLRLARWFLFLWLPWSPSAPSPGARSPHAALAAASHKVRQQEHGMKGLVEWLAR